MAIPEELKQFPATAPASSFISQGQLHFSVEYGSRSPTNKVNPISSAKRKPSNLPLSDIPTSQKRYKPEKYGEYIFYPDVQSIKFGVKTVRLKRLEFDLAHHLFRNSSRIISRAELWENIWKKEKLGSTRTIDTHVGRLRKLLELTPEHGAVLNAIHGVGYQLSIL